MCSGVVFGTQSHPYSYIPLAFGYFFTQLTVNGDTQSMQSVLPLVVEERKKDSQKYYNLTSSEANPVHHLCWIAYQTSDFATLLFVQVKSHINVCYYDRDGSKPRGTRAL